MSSSGPLLNALGSRHYSTTTDGARMVRLRSRPRVYHASDAPAAPTRPATGRPVRGRRLDQRVAGRDQNLCPRSWSEDTGDICHSFLRFSGGWKFLENFQKEVSADVEIISRKMYVPAWKSSLKPMATRPFICNPGPSFLFLYLQNKTSLGIVPPTRYSLIRI